MCIIVFYVAELELVWTKLICTIVIVIVFFFFFLTNENY